MYFLLFIFLIIGVLAAFLYYVNIKIYFTFNTNSDEVYLIFNWLTPFLKAEINVYNYLLYLSIFLFKKKIYRKQIKVSKRKHRPSVFSYNTLDFNNSYAAVYYGLNNPYTTGIATGVIQSILFFADEMHIDYFPDFLPEKEYIIIKARTEINVGKSIKKGVRKLNANRINKRRKKYGAA